MRAANIFAAAVSVFAILNTGKCQAPAEGNLTEVLPESPGPQNAKILVQENQNAGVSCSTIDDDSHLFRARNGLIDNRYRWKSFNVYVDPAYSDAHRNIIANAMRQLDVAIPCVRFYLYPKGARPSGDYIHIVNKAGCWSLIGKHGGRQELKLQIPGCVSVGMAMHEMIHALGFTHEQNRPDRDNYVNIYTANIRPGEAYNFQKVNSAYSTFGVAYNYRSIMHYGAFDFSRNNRATITKKNGSTDGIGSLGRLQSTDIQRLRKMYRC